MTGDRMVEPVWKSGGFTRPKKRARLAKVGRVGRARQTAWAKVVADLRRSTTACAACEFHHLPGCNGRYEHTHHVLPRSAGGQDTRANALPMSNVHHSWAHNNPTAAYRLGLLKKRGVS